MEIFKFFLELFLELNDLEPFLCVYFFFIGQFLLELLELLLQQAILLLDAFDVKNIAVSESYKDILTDEIECVDVLDYFMADFFLERLFEFVKCPAGLLWVNLSLVNAAVCGGCESELAALCSYLDFLDDESRLVLAFLE
jgi:hypothetical protein